MKNFTYNTQDYVDEFIRDFIEDYNRYPTENEISTARKSIEKNNEKYNELKGE